MDRSLRLTSYKYKCTLKDKYRYYAGRDLKKSGHLFLFSILDSLFNRSSFMSIIFKVIQPSNSIMKL